MLRRIAVPLAAVCALTAAVTMVPATAAYAQAAGADTVSLDLRDAPVRQALEQLFRNAGKNYSIDSQIQGYVTLKVTDQPFESALRLLMRSSNPPLTYDTTNGVYQVRQRAVAAPSPYGEGAPPPVAPPPTTETGQPAATTTGAVLRKMAPMIYQDSAALALMFGGSVLPVEFDRQDNGNGNNNSFGGGNNNSFGGGGFGGGFGGGNSFGGGGNNFGGGGFGGNSFGGGGGRGFGGGGNNFGGGGGFRF